MSEWMTILDEGKLLYEPELFSANEADTIFTALLDDIPWKQEVVGDYELPRLNAWYADRGLKYEYSGVKQEGSTWNDELLAIKQRVEACAEAEFNSLLLNRYRDKNDSIGFHSDAEPALGPDPVVATLSFGSQRDIVLKHRKKKKEPRLTFRLAHGSCFVMAGKSQHHWLHAVPKSDEEIGERISLTFRLIRSL